MARTSATEKTTRSRVRLKYVDVHCLRVFRFVKRKICSFTVEVGRRTFECDRDRLGCQPPRICLPRRSVLVIWVYNFPLHDGELCLFWQPVPGIGRCECEGHMLFRVRPNREPNQSLVCSASVVQMSRRSCTLTSILNLPRTKSDNNHMVSIYL